MRILRSICILALLASLAGMVHAQPPSYISWPALSASATTSAYSVASNDKHTVAAVVTGGPSGCSLRLEGTLDFSHWFDVSGAQDCTAGNVMFHVTDRSVLGVRANLTALSGGTSPTVTVSYLGVRSGGKP